MYGLAYLSDLLSFTATPQLRWVSFIRPLPHASLRAHACSTQEATSSSICGNTGSRPAILHLLHPAMRLLGSLAWQHEEPTLHAAIGQHKSTRPMIACHDTGPQAVSALNFLSPQPACRGPFRSMRRQGRHRSGRPRRTKQGICSPKGSFAELLNLLRQQHTDRWSGTQAGQYPSQLGCRGRSARPR